MTFPLDHISASFIKAYAVDIGGCHMKGWLYKQRADSLFDPRYAEAGSVVHSQIERMFNPQAEPFAPNEQLIDAAMTKRIKESLEGFKMIQRRYPRLIPGNGQQAEVEFHWHPEEDVDFLGYIDLLTVGPSVFIDDWKTGAESAKDQLQMQLYKTAISETMDIPTNRIVTTLHYLRQAKSKVVMYDGADVVKRWLKKEVIDPVRANDFKPNRGSQCARCEYRKICEAWS